MKIKHSKEWYYRARIIAYILGMLFCVLPTLAAAVWQLPVVVSKDADSTLSGLFIIALVCAALPLYKWLKRMLKSPNTAVICWVLFGLMAFIDNMKPESIHGLMIVFLFAAIGNTVGAGCFLLSKEFEKLWVGCGQVAITSIEEGGK